MKYRDKILICRNMACSDVASLFDEQRITMRRGRGFVPNCPDYNHENGRCGYDNILCKIVEYEKVKSGCSEFPNKWIKAAKPAPR